MSRGTIRINLGEHGHQRIVAMDARLYNQVLNNKLSKNDSAVDVPIGHTWKHVDVVEKMADEFSRYLQYARDNKLLMLVQYDAGAISAFTLLRPICNPSVHPQKLITPMGYPSMSEDIFASGLCLRYFDNVSYAKMRATRVEIQDGPYTSITRFNYQVTSGVTLNGHWCSSYLFGAILEDDGWFMQFSCYDRNGGAAGSQPIRSITREVIAYLSETKSKWYSDELKFYLEMQYAS